MYYFRHWKRKSNWFDQNLGDRHLDSFHVYGNAVKVPIHEVLKGDKNKIEPGIYEIHFSFKVISPARESQHIVFELSVSD